MATGLKTNAPSDTRTHCAGSGAAPDSAGGGTSTTAIPLTAVPLGVYAVSVDTPGGRFGGMANVGPRPSFPEEPPSLEVHLFDFHGDLYGATVTTRFHAHLRSQRRFAGLAELKAQLADDEAAARAALAGSV